MSLFGSFKNLMLGKPVAPSSSNSMQQPHPLGQPVQPASQPPLRQGPKVLPKVYVEEISCRVNGKRLDCYGFIRNNSAASMELDKVRFMRVPRELDTVLRAGEKRQFLLYSGPVPQGNHNHECELQYKDLTGDYFCGLHNIEFQKQPDNSFHITHVRYQGIRDI